MVVNFTHVQRVYPTRGRQLALLVFLQAGHCQHEQSKGSMWTAAMSFYAHLSCLSLHSLSGPMWSEWCEGNYVTTVIIETIYDPGTNVSTFHRWEHWTHWAMVSFRFNRGFCWWTQQNIQIYVCVFLSFFRATTSLLQQPAWRIDHLECTHTHTHRCISIN